MTTNVISELADKWWPLTWEQFFSPQRAPDMWFGDELPPTYQEQVRSPLVQQAKWMAQYQANATLQQAEQQRIQRAEMLRHSVARSRVGKRVKTRRH